MRENNDSRAKKIKHVERERERERERETERERERERERRGGGREERGGGGLRESIILDINDLNLYKKIIFPVNDNVLEGHFFGGKGGGGVFVCFVALFHPVLCT